jgi:HK97 family phage major capsid protein/HK97 family phage prohead protease
MSKKQRPDQLGVQSRSLILRAAGTSPSVDLDARTCTFPFSSEEPVPRWFGDEILSHAKGAMRTGVRQQALPLLYNHNRDDLLGVVESISLADDKRAYATVRFGRDERGDWAMQQAADGVLINASFMYQVFKFLVDEEEETYTATDWEVYEVSLVTVPADATVGLGRSADPAPGVPIEITARQAETPLDDESTKQPASAGFFSPAQTRESPAPAGSTSEGDNMKLRHVLEEQAQDGTGAGHSSGGTASATQVAEMERIRKEAAQDERSRVNEIDAMCAKHNIKKEIRDNLIERGIAIAEARGVVLNEMSVRGEQKPLGSVSDDIGLTDSEKRSFSLMRAVSAVVNGSWEHAGFEREVSQAIAKRNGKESGGSRFFFPNDLPFAPTRDHERAYFSMQRAMSKLQQQQRAIYQVGTAGQGGNLVATNLLADSFIEVLRNQSVTALLGATFLPGLVGKVAIPRQISQTGTYWVGESGAITEGEATFDQVTLQPRTIGALSKISRLMMLQSTPAIEMLARRDLMSVGALAIDLAALSGTGASNQPTGINNQAGVGSVIGGTNGANLSFDHIISLQYATKAANAPQASTGYALNSKSIGYLSTQKASTGQYLWDPQGGLTNASPDRLKGRLYAESQQLRSTLTKGTATGICSEAIYGNWQELLVGEWGVTEIAVNPFDSTGFANGDIILRMFQTIDIGVRHGASFAVMSDALTPGF